MTGGNWPIPVGVCIRANSDHPTGTPAGIGSDDNRYPI